jgi:hypothetical protein
MLCQPRQLLATSLIFHRDIHDYSTMLDRSDQEFAVANTSKHLTIGNYQVDVVQSDDYLGKCVTGWRSCSGAV